MLLPSKRTRTQEAVPLTTAPHGPPARDPRDSDWPSSQFLCTVFLPELLENSMRGALLLASDRGQEQGPLVCLALGCQTPELGRTLKSSFSPHFRFCISQQPIDLRSLLRGHCLSFPPSRLLCSILQPALTYRSVCIQEGQLRGDTEDGLVACSRKESRVLRSNLASK